MESGIYSLLLRSHVDHSKKFILQTPFIHTFIQLFIYHTRTPTDASGTVWSFVFCLRKLPHADWRSRLVDHSISWATTAGMCPKIPSHRFQKQCENCHNNLFLSPSPLVFLLHLYAIQKSHYSKLSIIKLHHNFSVSGNGVGGIFIIMASNWQHIKSKNPCRWLTPQKEALCPAKLPPPPSMWSWLMFSLFLIIIFILFICRVLHFHSRFSKGKCKGNKLNTDML